MWILSCDGGCLGGKKVWLKPGKTYLFGRTRANNPRNRFQVDHKSISRQHLTLSVSKLQTGDASKLAKRTEISLKDEGSKFHTELDGVKISGETKTLSKNSHSLRLGNSVEVFSIKWQPVVLTFSLTSKEVKASKDPLAAYRNRIETVGLDVKVTLPYIPESTTHVIAGKRNTAKGLSGLINGSYIVSERFIDAVVAAATSMDLDHDEETCQLEEDYEAHWPVPLEYLPDRSKETTDRPSSDFLPHLERQTCFEGYTFVFCDEDQYQNLHPPITHGGGKALHCATSPGNTTSEDIVRYVKRAAGETGLGEFEDGSTGKGVVVVRFRGKGQYAEWAARLDYEVAQALDHRLIEQSEFLDAILANDASMLRKPLLPEEMDGIAQNGEIRTDSAQVPRKPSPIPATTQKKREPIVSRFKGFDDDDDDEDILGASATTRATETAVNGARGAASQTLRALSSDDDSDTLKTATPIKQSQPQSARKRPAPPIEDDEEMVDRLVPQFAARKRQRLAEGHEDAMTEGLPREQPPPQKPQRKTTKPIDVKEKARERREAEVAAAHHEEENIQEVLEGMTVEQMKNLAVVEEMNLPARQPAQRPYPRDGGDRWDPAWNGRKNFKKFRHQGEGVRQQGHTDRLIVSLEPAKLKGYGIGEEYWLEREPVESDRPRRKGRDRNTQSQSQAATSSNSRPSDHHMASVPSELLSETAGTLENTSGTIDLDAPRSTRGQDRSQQTTTSNGSRSGGRGTQSQVLSERHDARNQQISNPVMPVTRKRKKFAAASESDHSDDDDVDAGRRGFRYAKRAR